MNYVYYKSEKGNFGDDLNPWLWPKVFGDDVVTDLAFIGIGSILYGENENIINLKKHTRKIIFGTGIRPSKKPIKIDPTFQVEFLRGPLSSYALKLKYPYIADAAYAIRQIEEFKILLSLNKEYKVSFMPYFKSVTQFNWKKICKDLGINYISPHSENGVEETLSEIAKSELLITEAMHGAILADALRVPWHRIVLTTPITEGPAVSEFKWMDWVYSIGLGSLEVTSINYYKKSFINSLVHKISFDSINVEFFIKRIIENEIINKLKKVDIYYLSEESKMAEIDEKFNDKIINFKNKNLLSRL